MSMSNAFEVDLAEHLFQNAAIADVGDETGLPASATAGSLYVQLHTADPGEAGNQTTSEATYTGYAREAIARSSAGFTVSSVDGATKAVNAALVTFGENTGSSQTLTHFSIGLEASGAGLILVSGALTAEYVCSVGSAPQFAIGALEATLN